MLIISGNWDGQTVAQSLMQVKGHWQYLSVDSFFSSCNWEGQRIEQNWLDEPSLWSTQISNFVKFISWEGKTEIGALPKEWLDSKPMSVFEVAPALKLTELF